MQDCNSRSFGGDLSFRRASFGAVFAVGEVLLVFLLEGDLVGVLGGRGGRVVLEDCSDVVVVVVVIAVVAASCGGTY